jgi:chromosome partitioning protein
MIVTVGNTKGGVGKSTVAVNLTVALATGGADSVLLVDSDEQATALAFTEIRSNRFPEVGPGYTAVALQGGAIRTHVRQLTRHYSHIVIDVSGRDSGSLRAALTLSDLLLIPVAPRSFDLWGVEQTVTVIQEARELNPALRVVAFLNMADTSGPDNIEAIAVLESLDLEVCDCRLVRRKPWSNAAAQGLSVLEYTDPHNRDGSAKAKDDFRKLFNWTFPERKLKTL